MGHVFFLKCHGLPFYNNVTSVLLCVIKITKNRPPKSGFLPLTCLLILASISIPFPHVQQAPSRPGVPFPLPGAVFSGVLEGLVPLQDTHPDPLFRRSPRPATLSPTHPLFLPQFVIFRMFLLHVTIHLISVLSPCWIPSMWHRVGAI